MCLHKKFDHILLTLYIYVTICVIKLQYLSSYTMHITTDLKWHYNMYKSFAAVC